MQFTFKDSDKSKGRTCGTNTSFALKFIIKMFMCSVYSFVVFPYCFYAAAIYYAVYSCARHQLYKRML